MAKVFTPHEYQRLAIQHATSMDRCNLWLSPGMGKTASTLVALQIKSMVSDTFPALVVGPMRVANSVWDREVEKWADFKGLRVVKVLGTEAERIAALRTPADIYTTHYGLLKWLHSYIEANGNKWPFKAVVADESTRLKHQRCSFRKNKKSGKTNLYIAGSVNAGALMRYAPRTQHWMNLTGTPASNGLKDLWGQHWPIDFGSTLGHSYDAFTKRWFYQRIGTQREQAIFEPLPHAFKEITERMKPTTISLDAYDWFDVERPREVPIKVQLPDRLLKDYRKLHREAVLKLQNEAVITAVNAGVVTAKCLQFASGNIYDADKNAHHLHDIKLDALESLVENLGGAPLLVAYNLIPTREAILKRFPQAVALPSGTKQKVVEDAWNEGRVPMLVVHPASAGHGLNLQFGGHNLCVVDPYWDLEMYLQVIERIGPVRQKQAGFDRLVNIYRIVMEGTFDEVVGDRMASKASVEDAVRKVMR